MTSALYAQTQSAQQLPRTAKTKAPASHGQMITTSYNSRSHQWMNCASGAEDVAIESRNPMAASRGGAPTRSRKCRRTPGWYSRTSCGGNVARARTVSRPEAMSCVMHRVLHIRRTGISSCCLPDAGDHLILFCHQSIKPGSKLTATFSECRRRRLNVSTPPPALYIYRC